MSDKMRFAIEDIENKIKWEQEEIDRQTKRIRESAAEYKPYDLVTFLPGAVRSLEEAINRQRGYAQQLEILQFVSKEEQ